MAAEVHQQGDLTIIELKGDMRKFDPSREEKNILNSVGEKVLLRAEKLQKWDSTTISLIYQIMRKACDVEFDNCPTGLKKMAQLAIRINRKPKIYSEKEDFFEKTGERVIGYWQGILNVGHFLQLIGNAFWRMLQGKAFVRWSDWWEALGSCGYKAVAIVVLACFMTGLILAFVGSLQLRMFGAQVYIASLVTIAMVRIMGAIMMGVIMAGRSGAQTAAIIGSMKVNEELDALKTLGIAKEDMVVLPRVVALSVTCPILTIFADIAGILGGMMVAGLMFDISSAQYGYYVSQAFSLRDFTIGIIHGGIYGFIIAVAGCYFGINCGKDALSVGEAATKAVVSSIVVMIVVTGILTWIIEGLGI